MAEIDSLGNNFYYAGVQNSSSQLKNQKAEKKNSKFLIIVLAYGLLKLRDLGVIPRVPVPKTERIRHPRQCKSMKGFYF